VSEAVKTLEKKGLIEKGFGQTDQRSFAIGLTAAGEALARQMERFAASIQAPVASLTADAQADLLLNLLSIIRHLQQQGIINVQRMCFSCRHYRPGQAGHAHFCQLLQAPLESAELRVDCPEHEAIK
jgi:DNA-binding MarR family transcriptional regulator